jgi:hypothetical protein
MPRKIKTTHAALTSNALPLALVGLYSTGKTSARKAEIMRA